MLALSLYFAMFPAEDVTTAHYLYTSCQAAVKFWDGDNKQEMARVASCAQYLGGYADGESLRVDPLFCLGNASVGTSARVYLAWMDRNPIELDQPRWMGVLESFVNSYPCPKK